MYTIYSKNQSIIFFADQSLPLNLADDDVVIHPLRKEGINSQILSTLDQQKKNRIFVKDNDRYTFQREFIRYYYPVTAAGGVVQKRCTSQVLFIKRHGIWDLPKGKLDPGESLSHCALRELTEETGIKALLSKTPPYITMHIYQQSDQWVLKTTHWYHMWASDHNRLMPATEEGITEACWGDEVFIESKVLPNTFPLVQAVLSHFLD